MHSRPDGRGVVRRRAPGAPGHHEEIVDHLAELGEIVVEPVAVGIFYKRGRTFAQIRPRYDHLVLSITLSRKVELPASRKPAEYGAPGGPLVPSATPTTWTTRSGAG